MQLAPVRVTVLSLSSSAESLVQERRRFLLHGQLVQVQRVPSEALHNTREGERGTALHRRVSASYAAYPNVPCTVLRFLGSTWIPYQHAQDLSVLLSCTRAMELASPKLLSNEYVVANVMFAFFLHTFSMLMYILRCNLTLYLST